MVLCQDLWYNVPGTLTIEVVADKKSDYYNGIDDSDGYEGMSSRTYAFSRAAFQDACTFYDDDMWDMLWYCFAYTRVLITVYESYGSALAESVPHLYNIAKAVSGHVTATRDGEEYDVATAMYEYMLMGDGKGYSTHTYVFTFERMGLRKDDIDNAEDWFYLYSEVHVDGITISTIAYILFLFGFLDSVETYAYLELASELIS